MLRTLLPLSLLIAGAPAQAGVPAPAPGPGVVDLRIVTQAPQPIEALASVRWFLPGPVAEPKWTLFVCTDAAGLESQRGWLEDLQKRFGEGGARIAAVLSRDDAKALAEKKPPFAVGAVAMVPALMGTCWFAAGMRAPHRAAVDGAADLLAAAADGEHLALVQGALQQLESLLIGVGDGSDIRAEAARLPALLSHSGRAYALPVLVEWWGTGDLDAARRQFDAGLEALATQPWALAVFADLVLRGDRSDPSFARELALALTPVATAAPDNPFVQLVQLRALLRAGQDKLAGRMLSAVGKLCAGDARHQVLYAETLMEANEPAPYRVLAEHALDAAAAAGFDPRWIAAARHKVLVRSGAPAAECEKFLADFRAAARIDRGQLNTDAWYMMVRPDTMGRFDSYALGQCEEMQRVLGDGIDYHSKDTVALALYLNGRVPQAVELQTAALAASGNDARYAGRLARYQNTLAAQQARKPPK
jgi:hypothetical protein